MGDVKKLEAGEVLPIENEIPVMDEEMSKADICFFGILVKALELHQKFTESKYETTKEQLRVHLHSLVDQREKRHMANAMPQILRKYRKANNDLSKSIDDYIKWEMNNYTEGSAEEKIRLDSIQYFSALLDRAMAAKDAHDLFKIIDLYNEGVFDEMLEELKDETNGQNEGS